MAIVGGEFKLIGKLTSGICENGDGVVKGVGDDTAILRIDEGFELLATCDSQVEGVHFLADVIPADLLGRRIAAVNLSDIAAMGGTPKYALISLAVPEMTKVEYLEEVYRGLLDELSLEGATLVGGNTTRSLSGLVLDLTMLGQVSRGQGMRRDAARSGDALWVTGGLGASAAGLKVSTNDKNLLPEELSRELLMRHFRPSARCNVGRLLVEEPDIGACIDVSDGLVADARHLAEESQVDLLVDMNKIPVASSARKYAEIMGIDPERWAAASGEEYELLFTTRWNWEGGEALTARTGIPVARIGRVEPGTGTVWILRNGEKIEAKGGGWDHFGD